MKYELILFILNKGHIDEAMTAAREAGATGGTILTGRGSAPEEIEKAFGIPVQQEKELLMILAEKEKRSGIMSAISEKAGLNKPGCGIGFSMAVEDVTGIGKAVAKHGADKGEGEAENSSREHSAHNEKDGEKGAAE